MKALAGWHCLLKEGLAGCLLPKAELTACSDLVALKMCAKENCAALRQEGENAFIAAQNCPASLWHQPG